ncbi:MAG: preprotein translocase subunit SecE [Firmicutes bacterium]|jgi:preprotein translocase subunit SecE|nr:preprotein translocase subunit SecE [Bacillota bacterium]HQD39185.1 preprotein translocase subunit SecE [Bacillota bacterium]
MAGTAATRNRFSLVKFLREVRSEMRKVTWLNRDELKTYTWVVIFIVAIVAVFIGAADWVFAKLLGALGILGV